MTIEKACTTIQAALAEMRNELLDLGATEAKELGEINRVGAAPVTKEETVSALLKIVQARAAAARQELGGALLSLARNPGLFSSDDRGIVRTVDERLDAWAGRSLGRANLETLILAVVGSEQIERAIRDSSDAIDWPGDAVRLADRPALIEAARQRGAQAIARIGEIRRQAAEAGVLL